MKSLRESILDDDEELFGNTNIRNILDKAVHKLPKFKFPVLMSRYLDITCVTEAYYIYHLELAWLRFFDVIIGNMSDFDTYKIKLFLKLFQYWLPIGLVREPSDNYDNLIPTASEEAELISSVHLFKQNEYKNIQDRIQKIIDKPEIEYDDLYDLVYNDVFGEKFIEFASDIDISPNSYKLSKQINKGLITIGFGDLIEWGKKLRVRI